MPTPADSKGMIRTPPALAPGVCQAKKAPRNLGPGDESSPRAEDRKIAIVSFVHKPLIMTNGCRPGGVPNAEHAFVRFT